ncbi:Dual specificity protein phosphatase 22 [Portunus trituberculatus]|uniref:Dual specificity protein phosphatase 22 n=1 Tax=Portunus trituberculatus TaxID=210409 RepID=A0A5B7JFZ7_PORTR|nr:Dual specificity protein phosphatase 22 [Portunus trituberculatus]
MEKKIGEGVLPGLYVGNIRDSKDSDQLKTHNITHILAIHDNARKLPCNSVSAALISTKTSCGRALFPWWFTRQEGQMEG